VIALGLPTTRARLADHSHERSDPLHELRLDVSLLSTATTRPLRLTRVISPA